MRRACIEAGIVKRREFVWVLDCRAFNDPEARRERGHVGLHPRIVEKVVTHRKFSRWLVNLKVGWARAMNDAAKGSTVVLLCYCKSGRHRSVACALIAGHLFEVTTGMPAPETVDHVCRQHWARLCGPQCRWCTVADEERDMALKQAREQWGVEMGGLAGA